MAVTPAVQEFLRRSNVAYTTFHHPPAFTAADEAAVTHTPAVRWAKTVACFADGRPILAVVRAHFLVDLQRLAQVASAVSVRLAREDEFESLFPGCEAGAMPPFGPLYHQRVFLETTLAMEQVMVFHAGTHRDAVRMHVADFVDLMGPVMARFGEPVDKPYETCGVGQQQTG
jgi:Ala-tRNA(Pro) deacylase